MVARNGNLCGSTAAPALGAPFKDWERSSGYAYDHFETLPQA